MPSSSRFSAQSTNASLLARLPSASVGSRLDGPLSTSRHRRCRTELMKVLGQPAYIMTRFDRLRRTMHCHTFNYIRINCSLSEQANAFDFFCFFLENINE